MCRWEAPTSGTLKWAAKQLLCSRAVCLKKNPVRIMINKQRGPETDDADLAASCSKRVMRKVHLASYQAQKIDFSKCIRLHPNAQFELKAASPNPSMPT